MSNIHDGEDERSLVPSDLRVKPERTSEYISAIHGAPFKSFRRVEDFSGHAFSYSREV